MRYGTIIQFFPARRFGFIRPDTGPDIFFHISALGGCEAEPQIKPGQAVKYELVPGTEPKSRRRSRRSDEDAEHPVEPVRPQAKLVELIDKIPGGRLQGTPRKLPPPHPRARRKKPSWRR
jgi:cold shock CspA family protein